jgi:glycosyltransferase involved in cell wall biosynthesis
MRITFLTHFPGRGGSTVLLQQFQDFFAHCGHSTEVICGMDDSTPVLRQYQVVPTLPRNRWRERRSHYLEAVRGTTPDIVYAISGTEEFDILRFLPFPRAHHIFSLEKHPWTDIPRLIHHTASHTELFTANTPDVLDYIHPLTAPSGAQSVIAPYRMAPLWFTERKSPNSALKAPIKICFCARLEPYQKRAHWLAKIIPAAHRRGMPLEWHIIGDGPCASHIRAHTTTCSTPVTYHGWLSADEIHSLYEQMDIFFLCSRWEGLPIAMVEAMASGLACVAPRIPSGIVHMLGDGRAGWIFDASSPRACVQALEEACADRELLQKKKRQAAQVARQTHSPAAAEHHLLALESSLQNLSFNGRILDPQRTGNLRSVSIPAFLSRGPSRLLHRHPI